MAALTHSRDGKADIWESPRGKLRMWMPGPRIVLGEAQGHLDIDLGHAFLDYFNAALKNRDGRFLGLHNWGELQGYDTATRKLFTRWTEENRARLERIVIYTESRIVRMGIATAKLVLDSMVDAVGTRAQLDAIIEEAKRRS